MIFNHENVTAHEAHTDTPPPGATFRSLQGANGGS